MSQQLRSHAVNNCKARIAGYAVYRIHIQDAGGSEKRFKTCHSCSKVSCKMVEGGGRAGTAMGPMFGNSRACGPIDGKTRQFHGLLVGLNGCRLILPPRLVAGVCRCNLSVCSSSSLCLKCCATALHITRFCEYETRHSHTHYSSRWVHNKFILKFRFNFLPAGRARDRTYE